MLIYIYALANMFTKSDCLSFCLSFCNANCVDILYTFHFPSITFPTYLLPIAFTYPILNLYHYLESPIFPLLHFPYTSPSLPLISLSLPLFFPLLLNISSTSKFYDKRRSNFSTGKKISTEKCCNLGAI